MLLLVALNDLGRSHAGVVGILPHLPAGTALAEQVPTLIERHLDLAEAAGGIGLGPMLAGLALECVLLVDQRADAADHLGVVHAGEATPARRSPDTDDRR